MSAVTARLGYQPFSDEGIEMVEVQLRRSGNALAAQVIRFNAGQETGRREMRSPTTDCSELFRAIELAVAIAIDPRAGLVRPMPPVARPVVPPAPPPTSFARAPRESEPPPTPTLFHIGLAPTGSLGTAPAPTLGFALLGGLRHGLFELSLGGRVELPVSLILAPGTIRTQALVGSLNACLAVSVIRACALGELGALRVTSTGLTPPAQQTAILADLGMRLGVHLQFFKHFALRPFLDVAAALTRTVVLADGKAVWVTSPVLGTLGLAVLITSGR